MESIIIDETLTLANQGIYDGEIQVLSLVIDGVEVIHNYTDDEGSPSPEQTNGLTWAAGDIENIDDTSSKITCLYHLRNADIDKDEPVTCSYDPEATKAFLKELDEKTGIRPKNRALTLSVLRRLFRHLTQGPTRSETHLPFPVKQTYISDRSGWHHIQGRWIYLTAEYAITAEGIDYHWRCTASNAHLRFDPSLPPKVAYQRILDLLNLDFGSTGPILTSAILSILGPLQKMMGQKPLPALLISGPTSSGKTQLAIGLAHILTDASGDLEQVFLLQNPLKKLLKEIHSLSGTTLILDDIRRSPSAALREKICSVLDTIVRDCYLTGHLLPILTGESDALKRMPRSLENRWIEFSLDPSPEALARRKKVIAQLHEEPLLVRTFFKNLIEFLASFLESLEGVTDFPDPEAAFLDILPYPELHSRSYDNLQVSHWAFGIFLEYGRWLGALSEEDVETFTKRYVDVLKELSERQDLRDPEIQTVSTFLALIKRMRIQRASSLEEPGYTLKNGLGTNHYKNTYGHQAIIAMHEGYSGVYIEDATRLSNYPDNLVPRTLLVIDYASFEKLFSELAEICRDAHMPFPFDSFADFKRCLSDQCLLLGRSRYDPNHPSYAINKISGYPCYNDQWEIENVAVLVFKLSGRLKDQIQAQCGLWYTQGHIRHTHAEDVEACAKCLAPLNAYPQKS
ncbi:hypothetical protein [Otoolea muris]|uniref:hypothetical protein n=1 Tax=Otoolea muris TaxID=2941515 RepID=UPI00203F56A6|nr:hypothetical protein [Otoolea muris]